MATLLILLLLGSISTVNPQEPTDEIKLFSTSELERFLTDYTVDLDAEIFQLVESAIEDLPENLKQEYSTFSRDQSEYSWLLLDLVNRRQSLQKLNDFMDHSKDPIISFRNILAKIRKGDLLAAERLVELRNDKSLSQDQRRAIETQLAIYAIPKSADAETVVKLMQRQDPVDWVGKASPDFDLPALSGEVIRKEDLRGKFVMLHFWATWCGPCVAEMPEFTKEMKNNAADDLVVICVSLDFSKEQLTNYLGENQLPGIQVLGEAGVNSQIVKRFHLRQVPSSIFIAPDGKVISLGWRLLTTKKAEWTAANASK